MRSHEWSPNSNPRPWTGPVHDFTTWEHQVCTRMHPQPWSLRVRVDTRLAAIARVPPIGALIVFNWSYSVYTIINDMNIYPHIESWRNNADVGARGGVLIIPGALYWSLRRPRRSCCVWAVRSLQIRRHITRPGVWRGDGRKWISTCSLPSPNP